MVTNNFVEPPPLGATTLKSSPVRLSPYLRFGCLSPRLFYQRLSEEFVKVRIKDVRITRHKLSCDTREEHLWLECALWFKLGESPPSPTVKMKNVLDGTA